MLGGPPPFRVRDQQGEDLNSGHGEMLGRRQGRRPHTAGSGTSSGAGSVFSSSGFAGRASTTVTSLIGSLTVTESPNGAGRPPVSAGSTLAGQLQSKQAHVGKQPSRPLSYSAFPAPSTTSLRFQTQPTRAMKTASPFIIRGGRKYLDIPPSVLPYPLSWDRDILDLQTMDHLDLFRLKGGVGSIIDFKGQAPSNVLDLGCGTGTWILDAATQWPDANFVGFDIAPIQLNLHLTNPKLAARVRWVHGNFLTDRLPFADGEFDHVNIRYIARGVPEDKWDGLFEEVRRVLCPGGSLGMTEEDILFPTLPRSFTARTRQRRKPRNGVQDMPKHDHALLEYLFFSVFERRFINTQPTSILLGVMNIYFKHCYAGPMWDLPYPPPPIPTDDHLSPMSSLSSSTRSSGPSSPSTSDGLPLPSPIPISGSSRIARTHASMQIDTFPTEQPSDTDTISPSRSRSMSSILDPNMHDVSPSFSTSKESTDRGRFNQALQEKAGDRIKHALGPVPPQPRWKPRSLALHLQHAYHNVLAMREAMWDELRLQLRDPAKRTELTDAGWEFDFAKPAPRNSMSVANLDSHVNGGEHHERPPVAMDLSEARARFDRFMSSYAADMHARTSVRDALSESLGWAAPPRAPRTKAEIALELDRERERAVARRHERESGFSEDSLVCRSHRGLCGFKEGNPTVPVSPA